MKKFLAIVLAILMVCTMSITAFADDETTLTINGADGREYTGYQLLTLITSAKDGHPDDCDVTDHTDCYNYAYSVNAQYRTILQAEVFANAEDDFWGEADAPATAAGVTDAQIIEYLAAQTGTDAGDSLRVVADRIYDAIVEAGDAIDAEGKELTGAGDAIAQGYWLFADVTDLDGENEANSLVMVDTKGQENLVINPKIDLPTVEKKVKDINDSADGSIVDNDWQDSADHDINDTVPFKLTATLPSNVLNYDEYTMIFHDTISAGLTVDFDSFVVYMYDDADAAADDDEDARVDVTEDFDIPAAVTVVEGKNTFAVGCDDILAIDGVTADSVFVVYYNATLNEDAVHGATGNPNEVYLEFSNNPYTDGTGETVIDKVIVFTYKVVINKTDEAGDPLEGAGFTLYKKNAQGTYDPLGEEIVGGDITTFEWNGLDDGDYKLEESTVPAGYNKMTDIEFTIAATHDEEADNPALTALDGGALGTGEVSTGTILEDIVNKTGTVLPETGAEGTMWLILGGSALVVLAGVFMITRKKMSVYED